MFLGKTYAIGKLSVFPLAKCVNNVNNFEVVKTEYSAILLLIVTEVVKCTFSNAIIPDMIDRFHKLL